MGLTDWKLLTVAGEANFKKFCQKEKDARFFWVQRWGWLVDEIIEQQKQILELKKKRYRRRLNLEGLDQSMDAPLIFSDPCPCPDTTNHEYGWLVAHPDWIPDCYGPYPLYPLKRKDPTVKEVDQVIDLLQHKAKMEREMERYQNRRHNQNPNLPEL